MHNYIALLRGINVVGRNILPMKALAAIFESLDCADVKTYIQSGNVVFRCRGATALGLPSRITAAIRTGHGFGPAVQMLSLGELEQIMAANPFPEAETDPKSLHVNFLDSEPANPSLQRLEEIKAANERFALIGKAFYLHAPDGIGRSKLAANTERLLGVPATSRNWRTVCKIREMAQALV